MLLCQIRHLDLVAEAQVDQLFLHRPYGRFDLFHSIAFASGIPSYYQRTMAVLGNSVNNFAAYSSRQVVQDLSNWLQAVVNVPVPLLRLLPIYVVGVAVVLENERPIFRTGLFRTNSLQ
jgi:hypothetical protein